MVNSVIKIWRYRVGYTLETLLGIQANSSKHPDYKGIELKSSRKRNLKGTLLSMVPNWSISNLESAHELVQKREDQMKVGWS